MGRRRSDTIREGQLGTVHVISRCTRRAFLMGGEHAHRRDWLLAELDSLLDGFCIDLLGYAVMSNHMHLILRPRPDVVAGWEPHRVASVGMRHMPVRTGIANEQLPLTPDVVERFAGQSTWVTEYRSRLSSVSWLVRLLKQRVAYAANREDGCTGHFWESRFHSVPLLDWSATLACMVYVDLNPWRARMAKRLEDVGYSSLRPHFGLSPADPDVEISRHLLPLSRCTPFDSHSGKQSRTRLTRDDYQSLLRRAAGTADEGDRERLSRLGARLHYDWGKWQTRMGEAGLFQSSGAGTPKSRAALAEALGRKWIADKTAIWSDEE